MEVMEPISRSSALINKEDCCILIIDVQICFMKGLKDENSEIFLNKMKHLIRISQVLDIPIIITAENIQENGTVHEEILRILEYKVKIFDKFIYSCWGQKDIQDEIKKHQKRVVILCGLETDVCIMQTAIDLLDNGYRVVLLSDLTFSRNMTEHQLGLKRIESQGAIVSLLKTWQEEITAGIRTKINKIIKMHNLDNI
ncbi:MAG: isochorismatase family protein [Candidatus Heimdallarchaeota archaeon]|nr:isochorismatase family protein [Candidatus Heimdallarchaeota archaeon]